MNTTKTSRRPRHGAAPKSTPPKTVTPAWAQALRWLAPIVAPLLYLALASALDFSQTAWIPAALAVCLLPLLRVDRLGAGIAIALAVAGAVVGAVASGSLLPGMAGFLGWLVPTAIVSPPARWVIKNGGDLLAG